MTASQLANQKCVPCAGGVPPLKEEQINALLAQLQGWSVENLHHLGKKFDFPDFAKALAAVNTIGAIAEKEGHHPDLHLSWGRVGVQIWTHKINGLTESDFVLAAKIEIALDK